MRKLSFSRSAARVVPVAVTLRTLLPAAAAVAALALLLPPAPAHAAAGEGWTTPGFKHWWLPPDYSEHGGAIDTLFTATFWITMVTWVLVTATMIVFMIKYRYRPDRKKAVFTHGNTKLEMCWTLAPALILVVLAVWNKGVWDRFRFSPAAQDPDKATILVIGQQFKWNVVYPGPDGKLGRYLVFPKPSDASWPGGKTFAGVKGPSALPYDQAVRAINTYIDQENPLGKDLDDPDGKDDDWAKAPGRQIFVPARRPVEVQLSSKDVIHSFFLPNFRVKLDAVPGLRGVVHFTSTITSEEQEKQTARDVDVKELLAEIDRPENAQLNVAITADSAGAAQDPKTKQYLYQDKTKNPQKPTTIVRHGMPLTKARLEQLSANGIERVAVYKPGKFEIVCEELCGGQHFSMRGEMVALEPDVYAERFEGKKRPPAGGSSPSPAPAATTKPSVASAAE